MHRFTKFFLFFFIFTFTKMAQAGVEIGGTRVIYYEGARNAIIDISNPDALPYLIQSWIENALGFVDEDDTFITTPPIFRLDPLSRNSIRIFHSSINLPKDRESFFWLNIKIIPSSNPNASNQLLIAIKNRLKLFYRPKGLIGSAADAYREISFLIENKKIIAKNPTPFYISLHEITVNDKKIANPIMLAPLSKTIIADSENNASIVWSAINDFGGITKKEKRSVTELISE